MDTRHKLTYADVLAMVETGDLAPDERVELLEGELITMAPAGNDHISTTYRLTMLFSGQYGGRCIVGVQAPLSLDPYTVPEPDLVLLQPNPDYYRKEPARPENVLLIVEFSMSSLPLDRERKRPLYARFGLSEYWIVNLLDNHLEVYRDPIGDDYHTQLIVQPGSAFAPLAFPDEPLVILPED